MVPAGIGPALPRCKRGVLPLDYGTLGFKENQDF